MLGRKPGKSEPLRVRETFEFNKLNICPLTTSTGFSTTFTGCKLVAINLDQPISSIFIIFFSSAR
jgi:hypothetical protein